MRATMLIACAGMALSLLGPPPASAEDGAEPALARLERAREGQPVPVVCQAIRDLAPIPGARVDAALRHVAAGNDPDRICAEAARVLGQRRGRGSLAFLMKLVRGHRKRPHALIGVIEGIGMFRSPRAADLLYDQARHFMLRQEKVTRAAIAALGGIRNKKAVEHLVTLLGMTERRQGYGVDGMTPSGPTSSETATKLASYRPDIVASLQRLTGEGLQQIEDWTGWWRAVKRGYRPPPAPPDPNRRLKLGDRKAGFEIERPTIAWRWIDRCESGFEWTCERREGEGPVAWLSIHVHDTKEEDPITVGGMLAAREKALRPRFVTVRESRWDEEVEFAGRKARLQRVDGRLDGLDVRLAQAIFCRKTRMWCVRWTLTTNATRQVDEEMTRFLASFELTD